MSEARPPSDSRPDGGPTIPNETLSALLTLGVSFLVLFLLAGAGHPYLLGFGEPPEGGPGKVQLDKRKAEQGKGKRPAGDE